MTFLETICRAFEEAKVPYAIVGGHAVALHGAVRGTVDIDFIITWTKKTLLSAENALNKLGLVSRLPINANDVFEFRDEYMNTRNLIAWNFYHPLDLSKQVDIVISHDLKSMKTKSVTAGSTRVKVLSINHLIDMKREAGREQDIADIKALTNIREAKQ
ncbi:MAG: hypothetical protein ACI9LY_000688 [Arenicella sp.]|jgi:hypothetical protein